MASIEGLAEPFRSIVQKILDESGGKVTISSGFRSRAEQQRLYDLYLSGQGNLAAKPGHSAHESGMAVDFGGDLELAAKLAAKYGLYQSVAGEPWHFTMGESATGAVPMTGYNLDEEGVNPQDVLANRLHSILRIIGQDATTGTPGAASPSFDDMDYDAAFRVGGGMAPETRVSQQANASKAALQQYAAQQMMAMGMNPQEVEALKTLWDKESGWNPNAQNPDSTAFGIAQFLDDTWAGTGFTKTYNPYEQINAGLAYIQGRYGSPSKALQFHLQNNWY